MAFGLAFEKLPQWLKARWDVVLITLLLTVIVGAVGYLLLPQPQLTMTLKPLENTTFAASSSSPLVSGSRSIITTAAPSLSPPRRASEFSELTVNINTADVRELQKLPRIGPKLAQRIVSYRQKNGLFKTPQELTRVSGIGSKSIQNLLPVIKIN